MKIRGAVWPVREFPKRDVNKNLLHAVYLSKSPRARICTKFCTAVGVTNKLACDDRLTGANSVGGQNLPLAIENASRRDHRLALPRNR